MCLRLVLHGRRNKKILAQVCKSLVFSLLFSLNSVAVRVEAHSKYITVFICLVITFSIVAEGHGVRWVCGTSGVNKLLRLHRDLLSTSLTLEEGIREMNQNSWWGRFTRRKKKKKLSVFIFKNDHFSSHKKPGDLQLLINLASHCWSIVITTTTVVIIILCCNKPIRWVFFSCLFNSKDTWLSYSVLGQAS